MTRDRCQKCKKRLNEVQYRENGKLKSCPECSRRYERHAYYHLEEFGYRTMADGSVILQSWCKMCRSKRGIINEPYELC